MSAGECFYCGRSGQPVESCCDRHPGPVCADREGCRDHLLAGLAGDGDGGAGQVPGVVGITLDGGSGDVARMAAILWCVTGLEMLAQSGQYRNARKAAARVFLAARITAGGRPS